MNETLTIRTERVDDIPLLLAQMQRMGLVSLLDAHFPTPGNREGLSLGWVTTIWLTHTLSQADHRMNRVQPWAERRWILRPPAVTGRRVLTIHAEM